MSHLDANGLRFHVQVLRDSQATGPRPKVVMLHGLVADNLSSYYYTIANPLALHADVHLYDLRGHGRSEMPKTGYAVVDHVADLHALLGAWDIDEPVHLVAASFGCVVALAFTGLYPSKVASLELIEGHLATDGWGEQMAGSLAFAAFDLDGFVENELGLGSSRKVRRMTRHAERLVRETSLVDELLLEEPFPRRALASITCPVLAIYGSRSDLLGRAAELESHLPDCELHILPGCTHSVLTEATPTVRDLTLSWLLQQT